MTVFVFDNKGTRRMLAHLPEVRAAVIAVRDEKATIAQALFAAHDHPGGHSISTQDDTVDALLSLDGPAPLSVEYGRSPDANGRDAMKGLHILGRAAGL
jgi:hypothetical protein